MKRHPLSIIVASFAIAVYVVMFAAAMYVEYTARTTTTKLTCPTGSTQVTYGRSPLCLIEATRDSEKPWFVPAVSTPLSPLEIEIKKHRALFDADFIMSLACYICIGMLAIAAVEFYFEHRREKAREREKSAAL